MKTIYKKLLFLFLLLPASLLAQSTLNGVVVDSKSNQPLPGVNVIVEGAQQSAVTDLDGKFQLSKLKKNAWKAMNGYTHGGLHQIARRMKSGNIQPNYESEEVIEVLKMSGFLSLMATLQIALLAENVDLEKEVNAKLHG